MPFPALDRYFDLAEYLALRSAGLISLFLVLYRVIQRESKRK